MESSNTILNSNTSNSNQKNNEIKRYLKLIKKRKLLISVTFAITFFIWMVYVITFQSHPKYTATALLTFVDPGSMSAVSGGESSNLGKAGLIKSTSLLSEIIEIFKLNISVVTEKLSTEKVFQYISVDEKTNYGNYKLIKKGTKYELFFKNEEIGIGEKKLVTFQKLDTVRINKMVFLLKDNISDPIIEFRIKKFDNVLQDFKSKISFELDRTRTLLSISGTFKSPQIAANIVNIFVEKYIQLLLRNKKFKTNEVMGILENQLEYARRDLEEANEKLKAYREKYPWVSLNQSTTERVNQIIGYENNKNSYQQKVSDLQELVIKMDKSDDINKKIIATQELLTYLSSEGITLVPAFQSQFTELSVKRNSLLTNYASTHPFVIENENEFKNLFQKIKDSAQDHIIKLKSQMNQVTQNINQDKFIIQKLPTKEIELAELIRDKDVKNDLYSNIATRYNVVKIANEVEVSDVSVIDPAVPPPVQSVMGNLIKKSLFGLVLALGLGVGLAIVMEFFNKTVEDSEELQHKLKLVVIGNIPFITNEKEKSDNFQELKSKKDSRLITLDYSPTVESEAYRDLRTKILYMNQNKRGSSFLITSLKPGEGKSLTVSNIAITFAQQKIPTVLVDADIRRGVLHNVFGNRKKPGLSDFIISKATIDNDNINKLIQSTFVPNLFLITAGSPVPNPTELHGSERMKDFINALKSKFGMVILDTPPFQGGSDSIILSNIVDSTIILVRANSTNVEELEKKIDQYPFFHEKILGVILNMVKIDTRKAQYQYSYYHY